MKVVSERLGHANIAFTMQTYQHVLPGMQADAARTDRTARQARSPARERHGGTSGEHPEEDRLIRGNTHATTKAQVADLGLHSQLVAGVGFEPTTFGL